jgi:hypothetical protein
MKFTIDIEIPRFTLSIPVTADTWDQALAAGALINPSNYFKTINGADWMDSDKPEIIAVIKQG